MLYAFSVCEIIFTPVLMTLFCKKIMGAVYIKYIVISFITAFALSVSVFTSNKNFDVSEIILMGMWIPIFTIAAIYDGISHYVFVVPICFFIGVSIAVILLHIETVIRSERLLEQALILLLCLALMAFQSFVMDGMGSGDLLIAVAMALIYIVLDMNFFGILFLMNMLVTYVAFTFICFIRKIRFHTKFTRTPFVPYMAGGFLITVLFV